MAARDDHQGLRHRRPDRSHLATASTRLADFASPTSYIEHTASVAFGNAATTICSTLPGFPSTPCSSRPLCSCLGSLNSRTAWMRYGPWGNPNDCCACAGSPQSPCRVTLAKRGSQLHHLLTRESHIDLPSNRTPDTHATTVAGNYRLYALLNS